MSTSSLDTRFHAHLGRSGLIRDGDHVLVALSGGLDSVVLLHLLRFGSMRIDLAAAHLDHAMRRDSGVDALRVRGLCRAWDVTLHAARAEDPPASEAHARDLRYRFLHSVADATGASAIATAHHADDQAETVLFRLARGTGLAGLAGIPARRGLIVRPLLPFTRAELLAYAHDMRIRWRDDPSNLDLRFARNRIRHVILPALERAAPGTTDRLIAIASAAADAETAWATTVRAALDDVLIERSDRHFVLARPRLLAYDPHVRARVMRHLLERLGSRPDRAGTRFALSFISSGDSGAAIHMPGGVRIELEFDRLVVSGSTDPQPPDAPLRIDDAAPGAGTFVTGGRKYAVRWAPAGTRPADDPAAAFDLSSLRFPLELRGWRAGDRVRLRYGRKKLKKLFGERRVALGRRRAVPILVDAAGEILWVVGVARSDIGLPRPDGPVLEIRVHDSE